jgi:hypothetical protein
MERAKNIDELIERFVKDRNDNRDTEEITSWLRSLRDEIEIQGRVYEIKEMIKYHSKASALAPSEEEKNTHLASIVVLEQRINFLLNPKQTKPTTSAG